MKLHLLSETRHSYMSSPNRCMEQYLRNLPLKPFLQSFCAPKRPLEHFCALMHNTFLPNHQYKALRHHLTLHSIRSHLSSNIPAHTGRQRRSSIRLSAPPKQRISMLTFRKQRKSNSIRYSLPSNGCCRNTILMSCATPSLLDAMCAFKKETTKK